jgi:hypothetical protein
MEIKINEIGAMLFQAHELGAIMRATNSMPCSLCREIINTHPDAELVYDNHFHGSNFGECGRKLYLRMLNGRSTGLNRASFLQMGHAFENEMLMNLWNGLPNGWVIKALNNTAEIITDVLGYKLVTHRDAYLFDTKNGKSYIVECKAIKDKYFKEIKKSRKIRDEWFGQGQSYLYSDQDVDGLIYLIQNRDTSELIFPILMERNGEFIAQRLSKLADVKKRITNQLGQPDREHTNPKDFECTFCPYKLECWSNE